VDLPGKKFVFFRESNVLMERDEKNCGFIYLDLAGFGWIYLDLPG
jgi:hypothetical protein